MKTIIAGSRAYTTATLVHAAIAASGFAITHVVSGGARGIDLAGEAWAKEHGVPVTVLPAEWDRFGKAAGYRRNEAMAAQAEALIAVWDGHSPGVADQIDRATQHGLQVSVFCPAAHPALLAAVQIAAAVDARQHYNDLHTAVWHARAAWERALCTAEAAHPPCSQALAHAQVALDRYRPVLLQALHCATTAAAIIGQPWPESFVAGSAPADASLDTH